MSVAALPQQSLRHKLTVDEFRAAWEGGAFPGYPPMELLDGELYEMPADGSRTIDWNVAINTHLVRALDPARYAVVPDKTLAAAAHWGPKPDFWVFDAGLRTDEVTGANVLLVIEVSDRTLSMDQGLKLRGYEESGVRDYWIADCEGRRLIVYRRGADGRFAAPIEAAFDETMTALLVEGLTLRLSDLPRI